MWVLRRTAALLNRHVPRAAELPNFDRIGGPARLAHVAGQRWGMTVPFEGIPLAEQADLFRELVDHGYTDAWDS
jgi:hypothetical protein